MRRFYLDRQTDVSGTSGTGAVVEGAQFSDGTCVVQSIGWLTHLSSFAWYKNIDDVVAIHGHNGATNLNWVDDREWKPARITRDALVFTHGDPSDADACGRPVTAIQSFDPAKLHDFLCPVHGPMSTVDKSGALWQSKVVQPAR